MFIKVQYLKNIGVIGKKYSSNAELPILEAIESLSDKGMTEFKATIPLFSHNFNMDMHYFHRI